MTFDARWKRIASCQIFPLLGSAQQLPQQHLSLSNGALVPAILSCCCAAPNFSLQRAPECLLISSHLSTPQRVCLWRNLRGTGNAVRLPLLLSPSVLVAPRPLYASHSVPRCVCVCVATSRTLPAGCCERTLWLANQRLFKCWPGQAKCERKRNTMTCEVSISFYVPEIWYGAAGTSTPS